MQFNFHIINDQVIAELKSKSIVIQNVNDALDLLANANAHESNKIIVSKDNITQNFFDLKTRLAGDILQKFVNYDFHLAIVGDFTQTSSRSLRDFIYESNRTGRIVFVSTLDEAIAKLSTI
jgi:hypothetical protein